LGKAGSRMFGVHGGRIGRAPDNDWVLPDPERYVSSHHASVQFRGGKWILEDTSTNGVFVNDSSTPISVNGPYQMHEGDRLRFGDYEFIVSISPLMLADKCLHRRRCVSAQRLQSVSSANRAMRVALRTSVPISISAIYWEAATIKVANRRCRATAWRKAQ
jgi:type VI secretion system FHA domain protein